MLCHFKSRGRTLALALLTSCAALVGCADGSPKTDAGQDGGGDGGSTGDGGTGDGGTGDGGTGDGGTGDGATDGGGGDGGTSGDSGMEGGANLPPSASFTATPESGTAPLGVDFDATASSDDDGTVESFAWSFGDGDGGTGVTTQHTFTQAGSYTVTLTVTDDDGATDQTTLVIEVAAAALPPDPSTVAPALDRSVVTDVAESVRFLYSGSEPIQTNVEPGAIEDRRVAVLRGRVLQRNGDPLSGVVISILDHPELGQTLSRADDGDDDAGRFDLAVNGGGPVTVVYEREGYLTVHREVDPAWRTFMGLPDVVMVPVDSAVTTVDLNEGGVQVCRANQVTDVDGSRRATLMVPPSTTAQMVFADGRTQPISELSIRATEFTVGDSGPEAMPAELPPSSGYTYALEYTVDEALAAGAVDVEFSQPLYHYSEDFVGFTVGTAVPTGYYDRERGEWIASQNGRVIEVLDVVDGRAAVDVDGDAAPDSGATLTALGFTDAERDRLGELYAPGQVLWRVPIEHFTPWDCNWPYGPPPGADYPNRPTPRGSRPRRDRGEDVEGGDDDDFRCDSEGSIIECQNRVLGQRVPVAGTPFTLNYRSDRVEGMVEARSIELELTGDSYPAELKRIQVNVQVQGRGDSATFTPEPNLSYVYQWDGFDAYGRESQGTATGLVQIAYVYDAYYYEVDADFRDSFGAPAPGSFVVPARGTSEVYLWQTFTAPFSPRDYREIDGIGGWSFDVHHSYDPTGRTLERGDGSTVSAASFHSEVLTDVVGTGSPGQGGDGGPATEASISGPNALAFTPAGGMYIADTGNKRIRYVSPDGIISTAFYQFPNDFHLDLKSPEGVAVGPDGSLYVSENGVVSISAGGDIGSRVRRRTPDGFWTVLVGANDLGAAGFGGDGGPAAQAQLRHPRGMAVGPGGSLYIADTGNARVRRVSPAGIITTVAGNGTGSPAAGGGGPATEAQLTPHDVAVAADGSLYIADATNDRVWRVSPDGFIESVVGTGVPGFAGDLGDASAAQLNGPQGIEVGPDGSLYIADTNNQRIRKVYPDGTIITAVGGGDVTALGWGTQAQLAGPRDVALSPDGGLYVADTGHRKIRRLDEPFPGVAGDDVLVPSRDGSEVYQFDPQGRHLRTLDGYSGAVRYAFAYDSDGALGRITDRDGRDTVIERNGAGEPLAIVGPDGHRTDLALDANGYLSEVSGPGVDFAYRYTEDGLLDQATDPEGAVSLYTYDRGRLTLAEDAAGGSRQLEHALIDDGYEVTVTTAEGRSTVYQKQSLDSGARVMRNVMPDGTVRRVVHGTDGSTTVELPDGRTVVEQTGPDPRWGMLAPLTTRREVTTAGGLASVSLRSRTATLTSTTDPLSLETLTETRVINGKTQTRTLDASSGVVTVTTPEGRQATLTRDAQGRVVGHALGSLLPLRVAYDENGRVESLARGEGSEERQHAFVYDVSGSMTSYVDPLGQTYTFDHDAAGRITSVTDPAGITITRSYDARGELVSVTPPNRPAHRFTRTPFGAMASYLPPGMGNETEVFYDLDRKISQIDQQGSLAIAWTRDAAGRVDTLVTPYGTTTHGYNSLTGERELYTGPDGESLGVAWDAGRVTAYNWSGDVAGQVARSYDDDFQLVGETVNGGQQATRQYDDDQLLTGAGAITLSRDASTGQITQATLDQITTELSYNGFGELVYRSDAFADQAPFYEVSYQRDALGRIASKTETVEGVTDDVVYGYDPSGRLATVTENGTTSADYTHDANGNLLGREAGGESDSGTYDSHDRVLTWAGASYTHADNGEWLTRTDGSDVTTYDYDRLTNLRAVELPDGTQIEYLIDGYNRRIGKVVDGTQVQGWLYTDGLAPVAELDGSNQVVSRFVYADKRFVPAYMVRGGRTYRIVSDPRGSVRLVVDAADGTIAQRLDYDAQGRVQLDTNPGFQPFGFAGGLYDPDTGLVRFGARDYDAETGRWTAKDPILFGAGDTNLYRYGFGDPVNRIDPSGLVSMYDLWCHILDELDEAIERAKRCRAGATSGCDESGPRKRDRDPMDFFDDVQDLLDFYEQLKEAGGLFEDLGGELPDLPPPAGVLKDLFDAGAQPVLDAARGAGDKIRDRQDAIDGLGPKSR